VIGSEGSGVPASSLTGAGAPLGRGDGKGALQALQARSPAAFNSPHWGHFACSGSSLIPQSLQYLLPFRLAVPQIGQKIIFASSVAVGPFNARQKTDRGQ
jgi:hypothetical protein